MKIREKVLQKKTMITAVLLFLGAIFFIAAASLPVYYCHEGNHHFDESYEHCHSIWNILHLS